jgi:hypothetical protein
MPVGISAGHYFGIIDLHFYLRVARQRRIKAIEKKIAMETMSERHNALELEFRSL